MSSSPRFWHICSTANGSHRTLVPLQYPPHVVALGSLYVAALLSSFEQPASPERPGYKASYEVAAVLSTSGPWETLFQAHVEDLEGMSFPDDIHNDARSWFAHTARHFQEIAHAIIDLLLQVAQNPSANTSPSTPSSPSPHPSPRNQAFSGFNSQFTPVAYKADQLIRLKIVMREGEHAPRPRQPLGVTDPSAAYGGDEASLLGRNEGTVRFLFGPPGTDRKAELENTERRPGRPKVRPSDTAPTSPVHEAPVSHTFLRPSDPRTRPRPGVTRRF